MIPNESDLLDNLGKIAYTLDKAYISRLTSDYGVWYFDEKYNVFLNELDNYLLSSSTAISSGMIGSFRSFMEDLLTDMANKIAESKNEEIPQIKDCKKMGNIRNYLQNKLELSSADNNLINKYIDVLHSEGGHSFTSNKEYFRLARNIGIEIVLLLLTKYDNLFNEKL